MIVKYFFWNSFLRDIVIWFFFSTLACLLKVSFFDWTGLFVICQNFCQILLFTSLSLFSFSLSILASTSLSLSSLPVYFLIFFLFFFRESLLTFFFANSVPMLYWKKYWLFFITRVNITFTFLPLCRPFDFLVRIL